MTSIEAPERQIIQLTGADRLKFLQGLVTRDPVPGGIAYSALLSPQGKFLADFFLIDRGEDILIDVAKLFAGGLVQRLNMYKLRADVDLELLDLTIARGVGDRPQGAFADPRHEALGWRAYDGQTPDQKVDWDAIRVAHCIPASGIELLSNETYILEAGFDRLGGVDHRKGCYVGQEVTARMKHKTELRKGFVTVDIDGSAEIGTPIRTADRAVGMLFSQSGGKAIAYLRYDWAERDMTAGEARVTWAGAQ